MCVNSTYSNGEHVKIILRSWEERNKNTKNTFSIQFSLKTRETHKMCTPGNVYHEKVISFHNYCDGRKVKRIHILHKICIFTLFIKSRMNTKVEEEVKTFDLIK